MNLKDFSKSLADNFNKRSTEENNPRNQLFAATFNLLSEGFEGNRKNAWLSAYAPFEFVALFDLIPLPIEIFSGLLAMSRSVTDLIDRGSELMECRETCSFLRACLGGIEEDAWPVPDVLIRTSNLCIGGDKLFHAAEDKYDKPYFLFDPSRDDIPHAVEYYAKQMEDAFHILEDHLGVKVTQSKIEEVFEYSNTYYANLAEIADLMKHTPTPVRASHIAALPWFLGILLGSQEGAEISKLFVDEIKNNIKERKFPIPDEKYRVIIGGGQPWYPNPLHQWLGKEKKVSVVAGTNFKTPYRITCNEPLDPSNPFISMARRDVVHSLDLAGTPSAELLCKRVEEYQIDGIISISNWGCHISQGSTPSYKNYMVRKNIPFIELNTDTCDERQFDFGSIQQEIELFLSLLDQRKKGN